MTQQQRRVSLKTRTRARLLALAMLASLLVVSTSQAHAESEETQSLQLQVRGGVLGWTAIEAADSYVVANADGVKRATGETSMDLSGLVDKDFYSLSVYAVQGDDVLAVERLRGRIRPDSTPTKAQHVSVREGMDLLATMSVRVTPASVVFTMPVEVLDRIDSWALSRNGVEVGSTKGLVLTDTQAEPGVSHAYSVVLDAPAWVDVAPVEVGWKQAECGDECPEGVNTSVHEEHPVSAHGLSFTLPVEVPEQQATRGTESMSAAGSTDSLSTTESTDTVSAMGTADDAYVWHNTFISAAYVNPPEPYFWSTDYWFSGDNRSFCSDYFTCPTRTWVRTQVDFEQDVAYFVAGVSPTDRYINVGGYLVYDSTRYGTNYPTVQYLNESGRVRVRVRHSASNPYETYYPAIDYEWEYVHVSDGGVTARGLHDGAPSYETFYQPPYTSSRTRVYTFWETNFTSLVAPMDQKGRSWCKPKAPGYSCPGFGTARWV